MLNIASLKQITQSIIEHQAAIIGPLAIEQANKVRGLKANSPGDVQIDTKTDPKFLLEQLVQQYEQLFGQASVEVCKDALKETRVRVSDKDLPDILK